MTEGSVPDWIAAVCGSGALIAAVIGAFLANRSFRHQVTNANIETSLAIFRDINAYWDRITDSGGTSFEYDLGQILTQFELASMLFNRGILTRQALPILKDHIIEVFRGIRGSDLGEKFIEKCMSSDTTLCELKAFMKAHQPTALRATTRKHVVDLAG